jgi:Cytochrome c554 and c-prime
MTRNALRLVLLTIVGFAAIPGCDVDPVASVSSGGASNTNVGVPTDAPRLRLRVSGNLGGYLMPCGCASGQMGGLGRRTFRNHLDGRNIDLFLEGGNLIKKAGELEFYKLITALTVLDQGDHAYQAIGLAALDLTLDPEELTPLVSAFPFVASDLLQADGKPWTYEDEDEDPVPIPTFREETFPHVAARIASLTMSLPEGDTARHYKLLSPQDGWARAMQGVADETYRIAMIHADREVIGKLQLSPRPDLIIAVNQEYVEPPPRAQSANGVPMVHVGVHGRLLLDITLVRGPDGGVLTRYAPVALKGSRTAKGAMRDKEALAIILGHRETVKEDGMLERLANQRATRNGASYVGAKQCAECHDDEDAQCASHAHSRAWKTLVEAEAREKWPVTSYPECVSCHVVGYGEKSGFVSPKKTKHLLNVTCENCHGPGGKHVASEDAADIVGKPSVRTCTACHNFEHSPRFDYTKYWKKIEHGR